MHTHGNITTAPEAYSPKHAELAKRIYLAVSSYRHGISYATMERRLEESGETIDASWNIVADKLFFAVNDAISERLKALFGA